LPVTRHAGSQGKTSRPAAAWSEMTTRVHAASEDQLVQSERGIVVNLVALYKALGGGWEVFSQMN
jgi:hypothetical protein